MIQQEVTSELSKLIKFCIGLYLLFLTPYPMSYIFELFSSLLFDVYIITHITLNVKQFIIILYFNRRKQMVRPIMKDVLFLGQKSETATKADLSVAQDLMDTLASHKDECVGMAANMIGVKKNIIVVNVGFFNVPMINPVILKKEEPFEAEEGCLSLVGSRKTTRYKKITVEYCDIEMKKHVQEFTDWTAQIIQHECDHLQGIII